MSEGVNRCERDNTKEWCNERRMCEQVWHVRGSTRVNNSNHSSNHSHSTRTKYCHYRCTMSSSEAIVHKWTSNWLKATQGVLGDKQERTRRNRNDLLSFYLNEYYMLLLRFYFIVGDLFHRHKAVRSLSISAGIPHGKIANCVQIPSVSLI